MADSFTVSRHLHTGLDYCMFLGVASTSWQWVTVLLLILADQVLMGGSDKAVLTDRASSWPLVCDCTHLHWGL